MFLYDVLDVAMLLVTVSGDLAVPKGSSVLVNWSWSAYHQIVSRKEKKHSEQGATGFCELVLSSHAYKYYTHIVRASSELSK